MFLQMKELKVLSIKQRFMLVTTLFCAILKSQNVEKNMISYCT